MIYKRGQVFWIKYYRNGKPYRESTKSSKEADAKRLLKKREGEISDGKSPGIYFDRVRFEELAKDFMADYRINQKKSLDRAERSLKHLQRAFGNMRVTNITTPEINAYIERRKAEGAANATINRELAALKRTLNLGARQTPPKVDRLFYIPTLQENNVRKGFFEYEDFLALREALPCYLRGVVTFAYKEGWRVSEIVNLRWSQVDLQQGIVRLEAGDSKNKAGRMIYLDEEEKEVFRTQWSTRIKEGRLTPHVFTGKDGKSKIKNFRKAWNNSCERARLGRRLFHDFRRTAVRNIVRSGIPERVAMQISGHKTRSVFDRYNIVSDTDLKQTAAKGLTYQQSLTGTKTGTIHNLNEKRANPNSG